MLEHLGGVSELAEVLDDAPGCFKILVEMA